MKGNNLTAGQVVVLELNGAWVYVEEVLPTKAKLVCLPDQPATFKQKEEFLTPGAVRGRVVSPFISIEREVDISELTERQRNFIGSFEKLRTEKGMAHIDRTPEEEEAAMTVKKAGPVRKSKAERDVEKEEARKAKAEAKEKKRADKAAAKAASRTKDADQEDDDEESDSQPGQRRSRANNGAKYRIIDGREVPKEIEKKNGELEAKFNEGNRGWKVLKALKDLGGTATPAEIKAHLDDRDPHWCANPEKVIRRALRQLLTDKFGAVLEVVS